MNPLKPFARVNQTPITKMKMQPMDILGINSPNNELNPIKLLSQQQLNILKDQNNYYNFQSADEARLESYQQPTEASNPLRDVVNAPKQIDVLSLPILNVKRKKSKLF
jgi:hypothetical protein